jgi:hypothetical protein
VTEEEALAALDEQADDTCSYCGLRYAEHCQDCWHCPGTHDELCGW